MLYRVLTVRVYIKLDATNATDTLLLINEWKCMASLSDDNSLACVLFYPSYADDKIPVKQWLLFGIWPKLATLSRNDFLLQSKHPGNIFFNSCNQ